MSPRLPRLAAALVAVAALLVPVTAAPVAAATRRAAPVDWGWPTPGYGYAPGYGYDPSASPYADQQATTDSTAATAAESTGLALITNTIDFGEGEAAGTGIVVRSDGIVVTNHHVVEGATRLRVTVAGQTYRARLLGSNTTADIAVLKLVGASGLSTATLSDMPATVGGSVTAVGNAGGTGTLTAASGSVTALRRTITVGDELTGASRTLRRLIEVDADLVPGDSGGALLGADGSVVGMNVAASEGSTTVDGYAIPVASVEWVLGKVLAGEATARITLGYAGFLGVSLASGTVVSDVVSGGPADAAGLTAGDTITAVDGHAASTATRVSSLVKAHRPGESVTVTWTDSAGSSHTATITLARAPIA